MYLIYLDESGNTGTNLNDPHQPVFVLVALLVPEERWSTIEVDLQACVERFFPSPRPSDFEVHATELSNPRDPWFKKHPIPHRLAFRDAWFQIARDHGLKLVSRAILKKRFQQWVHATFGAGVSINPHVAAFPLVARVVDDHLRSLPDAPRGIFIADECQEVVRDVEKAIRVLRGIEGTLRLGQIIEKGFFIESDKSLLLQLCDVCCYSVRKAEELSLGLRVKPHDATGAERVKPLMLRGDEALRDVIEWLTAEQKKGAARG